MARRITRGRFVRPAGRTSAWLGMGIVNTNAPGSAATLIATYNAAALAMRPFTIVRTHLVLSVVSDQIAASELAQGAFAMQVVTEAATSAGIASIPTPLVETDADFLVYQGYANNFEFITGVGYQQQSGSQSFWVIDSKAMRKVQLDDDLAVTIENRGAAAVNFALEGRQLVKLH